MESHEPLEPAVPDELGFLPVEPLCLNCGHRAATHTQFVGVRGDCLKKDDKGRFSCQCEMLLYDAPGEET